MSNQVWGKRRIMRAGARCAVRWALGGAPHRWVAVSLVESLKVEGEVRGDRRTMIVNDAQCQGWEVQSGNHSIPDHTRGLYVYVESTLLIYTLYMLRTLLTGRKSRECESQSTSQSSYHKLETVTSVTSSMSSPSATYSPHPVLHTQLTVCCE